MILGRAYNGMHSHPAFIKAFLCCCAQLTTLMHLVQLEAWLRGMSIVRISTYLTRPACEPQKQVRMPPTHLERAHAIF